MKGWKVEVRICINFAIYNNTKIYKWFTKIWKFESLFGLFGALFSYSGNIGLQVYVVVGSPEIIHFSVEISLVFEKLFVSKEDERYFLYQEFSTLGIFGLTKPDIQCTNPISKLQTIHILNHWRSPKRF